MINILIVDDESDIDFLMQQRYRHAIKEKRLNFFFARNGQDALQQLEQHSEITIMVTDLNMPIMNGLELLQQIKDNYPQLKKFALSAYSDYDNIQLASKAGAEDFITKPIDFADLEHKLGITQ